MPWTQVGTIKGAKGDVGNQGVAGVAGVAGPASTAPGPPGPAGAASTVPGPAGPQGNPGATMLYRGAWSSGSTYLPLDTVSYNGSSYVATATVPAGGANPSINASWAMMAQAGSTGTAGSQWYTGSGAPAGGAGVVGDWYLNSANGDYYSKTGASTWTLQGNLKGVQGNVGPAGPTGTVAAAGDGTAALPSITFASDTNTGFWRPAADTLGISTGGFSVSLIVEANNLLAQRNGTSGQSFFLYKTDTGGGNYERLEITGENTFNTFSIYTQRSGSGLARPLYLGTLGNASLNFVANGLATWQVLPAGHFVSPSDNTYDIGAGGLRPRNLYLAGTASIAGVPAFAAGDKYLVIDASGNIHKSAIGPAS